MILFHYLINSQHLKSPIFKSRKSWISCYSYQISNQIEASHKAGHKASHKASHKACHKAGHKASHEVGHKASHKGCYKAGHKANHKTSHKASHNAKMPPNDLDSLGFRYFKFMDSSKFILSFVQI